MSDERSDEELLALAPDSSEAFASFYLRHVDKITRYAARRCSQPADVADLVASTFLSVLRNARTFDPSRGDAIPWLYGIAARIHAGSQRKRAREIKAMQRLIGARELSDDDIARLEERMDAAHQHPLVEHAIHQLPKTHREALWLVGYDGLDHEAAAAVMGVSVTTFRMRLSRARRSLKKQLGTNFSQLSPKEETS